MGSRLRSIGRVPADWAASTQKATPRSLAISPTASTGITVPVTLDTCINTTRRVFPFRALLKSSGSTSPVEEAFTTVSSTPFRSKSLKGRMTELCSMLEVTTWSPGLSSP